MSEGQPTGVLGGVLVTRPNFAEETAQRIAALGYVPVIAPMLTVHHNRLSLPPGVQAILVTSSNALPALPPVAVKLLAVGQATAARARAHGFADVAAAQGDASSLLPLAAGTLDPQAGKLLLASAAGQGQTLAASLRGQGFRVIRRVAYEARPVRRLPEAGEKALRARRLHAALFLSAETARAFVRLLPPTLLPCLGDVIAIAIAPGTARVLEPLPWLRVCAAATPTLDDVLARL